MEKNRHNFSRETRVKCGWFDFVISEVNNELSIGADGSVSDSPVCSRQLSTDWRIDAKQAKEIATKLFQAAGRWEDRNA